MDAFQAEIRAGDLAAAARRVAVVAARSPIPIIENALLCAESGNLTLAATNMNQGLSVSAAASGAGQTTAPAQKLSAIAAQIDADATATLSLDERGQSLSIRHGRSIFKLPALPAGDWPAAMVAPVGDDAERWTVSASALLDLVQRLEGAINGSDTSRPHLCGLYLDLSGATAALVASDSHVLGWADLSDLAPPRRPSVILPASAIRPIVDIAKAAGSLDIGLSAAAVTVEAGGVRLRTKLIVGEYPPWRRLLPDEMQIRVTVEADRMALALRRVMLVTAEQADSKARMGTAVSLRFGAEEMSISARNGLGEEASDAFPCERLGGADDVIEIQTRAPYLSWAIDSLNTDTIDIGFDVPTKFVALRKVGDQSWSRIVETRRM